MFIERTEENNWIEETKSLLRGAAILLFLLGVVLILLINPLMSNGKQMGLLMAGLLFQGVSALVLPLENRMKYAGRLMVTLFLSFGIFLGSLGWNRIELLALLFIPVGLATIFIDLKAALRFAGILTSVLVLGMVFQWWGFQAIVVPVVSLWAEYLFLFSILNPLRDFSAWTNGYYRQAQSTIQESREQRMELKQTLEDLLHANEQLSRLNNLAQSFRQIAEDARTAKEQFVANVSHELRTPLNMIIGFSENILQAPESYGEEIPPTLLSDLLVIHRNAQHLSHLIDDVLDLSQLEADQMALTKEWVDVREIAQSAVIAVRPLYQAKNLYLVSDVSPDLPLLFCDPTRIREVLLNLLSNAGRFAEKGGVHLSVCKIERGIRFSVADTGPGISEENMKKLFQPFQQLDGSIRRRFGGTGLGLMISKRFVEQHDGKIWIESRIGAGSTFNFEIPFEPILSAANQAGSSRWISADWEYRQHVQPSKVPHPTDVPRFIVVEKGKLLKRLLNRYIGNAAVLAASTIREAGVLCQESVAHAIIVNSNSLEQDQERALNTPEVPDSVPIFFCSLNSEQAAWSEQGIVELLAKPVTREMLSEVLNRFDQNIERILVVDDEPDILQLFGRILGSLDHEYRVLLAHDGQEALELVAEAMPDVILLDVMMPNMNGYQFLERFRQIQGYETVPVILVSAQDLSGQPIVSNTLTITRRGGISTHEFLQLFGAVSPILSIGWPKSG